jgi:hypothetical protein
VIKTLYESVISADTRRRLGEYSTPDRRAEAMVDAAVPNPLQQRVMRAGAMMQTRSS